MRMKTTVELDPLSISKFVDNEEIDLTEELINKRIKIHNDKTNNYFCHIEINDIFYNFRIDDIRKALANVENTSIGY